MKHSLILKVITKFLVPVIVLFALYVQFHGDFGPGGGFQAGVIFSVAFVLYALVFGLDTAEQVVPPRVLRVLASLGVLIYAGTGMLCLLLGGNFLDYGRLAGLLGVDPVMARSHGILIVEIGVGLAVMAVMVMLYYNLSSAGRHDEGL